MLGRVAGTTGLALAGLLWPTPNALRGGTDLPLPGAGVAEAGDEWCDVDPILIVNTPKGNLVTLFYMTGVKGPLYLVSPLLGLLTAKYSVAPDGAGTRVTLCVTIPKGFLGLNLGASRPARVQVSSGPLGSGQLFGATYGETGKMLCVDFRINVP